MPETMPPPSFSEVPLEQEPFHFGGDKISDDLALTMVIRQFAYAEQDRRQNYDSKWNEFEALYEGAVQQRYWPGSESQPGGPVERSSLPLNIAFDHVEGPLSRIEAELFSNPELFQLEPLAGATIQDSRDQQIIIERDLYSIDPETFESGQSEIRSSMRGTVTYGNGLGLIEFDGNRVRLTDCDLKDIFIDPGCRKKNIDAAKFVILRTRITAEDLAEMRENKEYAIPPDSILNWLLNNPDVSQADNTVANTEAIRGVFFQPGSTDVTPIPSLNPIVLYRYYDNKRIIFTLNNRIVIYNGKNPYGWKPFYSFVCREKKGRFYGTGYPEAIRWYQRMAEGLQNAHLDEVHLGINAAVTGPMTASAADLNIRPGRKATVENPQDVVAHMPSNITSNAFAEVAQCIDHADRRNGVGMMSGSARPGQVRTAKGVAAQETGSDARIAHVLSNIEEGIKILIEKMRAMYRIHTMPNQVLEQVHEGDQTRPIMAEVFHRPAKVKIETVRTMLTRDRLGPMIQPILTTYYNPIFIERQNQQGKTVNDSEIESFIGKATGLGKLFNFLRPLNQQEQQALQQPPPQVMVQMQTKQGDQQLRRELGQLKHQSEMAGHQAEITKAQISNQPDPFAAQQKAEESRIKVQEMIAKIMADQQSSQQKLEFERMKGQQDLMLQREKMNLSRAEAQEKMRQQAMNTQAQVQSHGINLQMQREEAVERRQQAAMDAELKARQATQQSEGPKRTGDEPKKPKAK